MELLVEVEHRSGGYRAGEERVHHDDPGAVLLFGDAEEIRPQAQQVLLDHHKSRRQPLEPSLQDKVEVGWVRQNNNIFPLELGQAFGDPPGRGQKDNLHSRVLAPNLVHQSDGVQYLAQSAGGKDHGLALGLQLFPGLGGDMAQTVQQVVIAVAAPQEVPDEINAVQRRRDKELERRERPRAGLEQPPVRRAQHGLLELSLHGHLQPPDDLVPYIRDRRYGRLVLGPARLWRKRALCIRPAVRTQAADQFPDGL